MNKFKEPLKKSKRYHFWGALLLLAVYGWYCSMHDSFLPQFHAPLSNWTEIRLPHHIKPFHYDLSFSLSGFAFDGNVVIGLEVEAPTHIVVVHNLDMDLHFNSLKDQSASFRLDHIEHRSDKEYSVLFFKEALTTGRYQLSLSYNGTLSNSMEGFYSSRYRTANGKEGFLATTQFEPVYARRAFPCLDEPDKKAVFDITIGTEPRYHALSNMPVKSVSSSGDVKVHVFEPTVVMSSYLIAFVVSDFESISSQTKNGIQVKVWTPPGLTHLGEYALESAVGIFDYYQSAYGIDYPLTKSDLIAIPDFAAGAMENWGLITFRDTALLYDPKSSTASNKERVAVVVAHELAHQWFGNLVTMKWWNDLWLNEGFAEFMEYKGVQSIEPSWKMQDTFIPSDLVRALRADESVYTHSIALPVEDPNEINNIFDDISYGKGSSVIRMLEAWMDDKYGPTYFFSKIHNYLKAHAYSNAETKDLWDALRTEDQDVGAFMHTWTNQPGFPFVTLSNIKTDSFTVKQSRFVFSHLINAQQGVDVKSLPEMAQPPNLDQQVWSVPLSYGIYSNASGKPEKVGKGFAELNTLGQVEIKFEHPIPSGSVMLLNYLQTGVYRSLYDESTYRILTEWLTKDKFFLPAVERAGLYSDVFSMTFSGRLKDPSIALNLIQLLATETNIFVWEAALKDLETLKDIFALSPSYGLMIDFQANLLDAVVASVGWEDDQGESSHLRSKLRARLLQEAIRLRHPATTSKALKYFGLLRQGKGNRIKLSPDVYGAIFDAGVIHGTQADYNWVLQKYLNSTFAPEQQIYLHALASSPIPYLQARTLAFAISGQVRQQDIVTLVDQVATLTPVGHVSTWLFLMDNWDALTTGVHAKTFGKFNQLLNTVCGAFTKPYLIREAERLFVRKEDPTFYVPPHSDVSVLKGLETAKQLLAWRDLYGERVEEWLEANAVVRIM